MKISINKAIKLRNKLASLLAGTGIPTTVFLVPTSTDDINMGVASGAGEFAKALNSYELGIKALISLRAIISKANHESGADAAMRDIARQELRMKLYEALIRGVNNTSSAEDAIRDLEYRIAYAKRSTTDVFRPQRISVTPVDKNFLGELQKELASIKLSIDKLTENRNELNYKNVVELPEDVVSFLKGENLI